MHNQHTDLSQTFADQHRTHLQEQASGQRLRPAAPQHPRRPSWAPHRWWQQFTRRPSPGAS